MPKMTMLVCDARRIDLNAGELRQLAREEARVGVVFAQPVRHFFQRDQSRRRQHARLAHAAAQALAIPRARSIASAVPTSMEPTGAPRPFDKQNITESAGAARSRTGRFRWQAALKMRAPSSAP
jgi:hypothetical protein